MDSAMCSGCRQIKDRRGVPSDTKLPARKLLNGGTWADVTSKYQHFCLPIPLTEVFGVEKRQKVQAELALGSRENIASAKVRIECRVAQNYNNKTEQEKEQISDKACGNAKATKKALYRAQIGG